MSSERARAYFLHGEKEKKVFDIDGGDEMISTHLQPLYNRTT